MLDTGSATFRAQVDALRPPFDTAMAFVWFITAGNTRAHQVGAGRDYVRANLAATAAGVAMQPLSQALQEFPEMAPHFAGMREALDVGASETVQMFARLGYGAPVKAAPGGRPRRGSGRHDAKGRWVASGGSLPLNCQAGCSRACCRPG